MKIKFKQWECEVFATYYKTDIGTNKRKAIVLKDDEGVVATATVNMPKYLCGDNQIYVKDYSENTGMLQALINNGIVDPVPANSLGGKFVTIPLMNLTEKGMKLWQTKEKSQEKNTKSG